ncbi:MAG: hypothetical protein JWM31_406, partial [Solirubrobacterales bacterium]|nr:hypothetical protein [Solirubrobacterales bacterium]
QALGAGVYAMTPAPPSARGRCWAALLHGDPDSALSHRTAAVIWQLIKDPAFGRVVHVTSRRHRRSRRGVVAHQARLPPSDLTRRDGLRVTSLARTLLDLAATESEGLLLVAVRQALTLHGGRKRSLFAILDRAGGHRGRGPLRRALRRLAADPGRGPSRGTLEDRFWLALVPRMGELPPYQRNLEIRLPSGEVYLGDIVFPDQRTVVELDFRGHHDNDPSFDADRLRDRRLAAVGWLVVRITGRHLDEDAPGAVDDLLSTLAHRV